MQFVNPCEAVASKLQETRGAIWATRSGSIFTYITPHCHIVSYHLDLPQVANEDLSF